MSVATVFLFSGQGSQSYQMGKELYAQNGVFRDWMLHLDGLARQASGKRVLEAIYGSARSEVFDRTLLTHPAIFMVEYALAQCLIHDGIRPDLVLGASLGSFAAAAVAGYIGLEEAMQAVVEQARAFEDSCERGGMIAVLAEPILFEESFLCRHSEMVGINLNNHFAVAAPQHELDGIEAELRRRGVIHQRLAVSFAFHSRWVDNAREQFVAFMGSVPVHPGRLPLVCCAQAAALTTLPYDFFWRMVRQPIHFKTTIDRLEQSGPYRYIDVGPSGTMATFVKHGLPASSRSTAHAILTPFGRDRKNLDALIATC